MKRMTDSDKLWLLRWLPLTASETRQAEIIGELLQARDVMDHEGAEVEEITALIHYYATE